MSTTPATRAEAPQFSGETLAYDVFVNEPPPEDGVLPNGEPRVFSPMVSTLIYGVADAVLTDPGMTAEQARALGVPAPEPQSPGQALLLVLVEAVGKITQRARNSRLVGQRQLMSAVETALSHPPTRAAVQPVSRQPPVQTNSRGRERGSMATVKGMSLGPRPARRPAAAGRLFDSKTECRGATVSSSVRCRSREVAASPDGEAQGS